MAGESPAAGCPAPSDSETAELAFDGITYILTVRSVGGDSLEVVVEQKEDASAWSATFAAKYVEEITAKTGSFKRFPVFVKMLLSALRQESDSVFVDLLTYRDLELLRSKRGSGTGAGASNGAAGAGAAAQGHQHIGQAPTPVHANKRYLILTYAAEFDRVHYPLPLLAEEHPDPQRLKATIRQLRAQLAGSQQPRSAGGLSRHHSNAAAGGGAAAGALPAEVKQLRDENAALRAQVRALEAHAGGASLAADMQQLTADAQETIADLRGMRRERDSLLQRLQAAEAALEGERNLHRRELRRRAKEAADVEAELAAAKDQIRELRLKCRELTQELDLAQRRAKVASMSTGPSTRQPVPGGRIPGSSSGGGTGSARGGPPSQSRGMSPASSRHHSRDTSPAPIRRAPLPGPPPPRSRSADVSRPGSRPTSRPSSAGRFDPTEYVKMRREREWEAARHLDNMRRAGRLGQSPGSRPGSLPGSRPPSKPSSRHSTPQRSRVPSRDPSAERARQAGYDCNAGRGRPPSGDPRDRRAAVRSTERLRAAVATTTTAAYSIPPREQRATSPGRALLEVRQRLQQYAGKQPGSSGGGAAPGDHDLIAASPSPWAAAQQQQGVQRVRVPPTGDHYADASADIADIDSRLQSLQMFLKAAKAGQPAAVPM